MADEPQAVPGRAERALALAGLLEHHDRRLAAAGDGLVQTELVALARMEALRDDMTQVASVMGRAALAPAPPRSAPAAPDIDLSGHPAIVDAERLVREAERSMRRAAPPQGRKTAGARTERQIAFVVSFAVFLGLGWVAARSTGQLPGDAVSRVQAAQAVVAGRDPHLEALGFIWGPFPALFEVPITWLRQWWLPLTGDALAAVIVSAAFMAGVVMQILRWGEESGAKVSLRMAVLIVTVAHPLIWLFGANGMSEACWLFFLAVAARRLALWHETDDLRHLAITGAATGFAYLVRYESAAIVVATVAFVGIVTFSRWHPSVDDPSFGEPRWEDDRDRIRRTLLDVTLVALPAVACIALWALSSWAILGEPFPQFSSEYGNSAIVKAASGQMGSMVPDFTKLGRAWFYLVQVGVAAPAIVLLLVMAVGSSRASSARVMAAAVVFGSPLAVQLLFSYQGSTFPWFRYSISAVLLAAFLALTLGPASRLARFVAVVALVPGVVLSGQAFLDDDLGVSTDARMLVALGDAASGGNPREDSLLGAGRRVAVSIDAMPDVVAGSVICDAASCFPVIANAPRPEVFVIPSDRDFEPLAADPQEFGVRYILLADPQGAAFDAIRANHPNIWERDGAPIASVVREWGEEGDPTHFRLYRVLDPKGEPRPEPDEDLVG